MVNISMQENLKEILIELTLILKRNDINRLVGSIKLNMKIVNKHD